MDERARTMEADGLQFKTCDEDKIHNLVTRIADRHDIRLGSCLDVGCGLKPVTKWFQTVAGKDAPHTGTETDPAIIAQLRARGFDVVDPFATDRDLARDLVIAKEVAEHIKKEDSPDFFRFCARNTRRMFAMTTPNFEHWLRLKPNDVDMRFMPAHMLNFDRNSDNPHFHKQVMTPASVHRYLTRAFGRGWTVEVYRAWPWTLTDRARGRTWDFHFKIFGIAWRNAAKPTRREEAETGLGL